MASPSHANTKPVWNHVWLTGASSGLGEFTARALAKMGCTVSITARSRDKLEAIAADFDNVHVYEADVTDHARIMDIVDKMEEAHGPIDLCILSAGAWFQSSIKELKVENFRKTFDVNLMGVVYCLDAMLPRMRQRGGGHVSWIASVAGYGGLPNAASYGASKAALIHFAETAKPELERDNITVSLINPGFVRTPMTDKNDFPMPFLMEPEDAADKIVAGLKAKKFEIAFPWQLVTILKVMNHLPYWLYFWIIKKGVLRD
ncbi:MAG: SDR family NAD(P)-dependent oxidoreductase [Pseudomonadota bacterium]